MPQKKNYKYSGRKRGRFKKAALGFFVFAAVVAVAGAFGVAVIARGLPDPLTIGQRKIFESTKIYDRTGKVLLYEVHGEEKRTVVPFAQINQRVKDATIVAEDFDFYEHSGIDFKSILRAFFIDVSRWEMSQGGSTITQQLVKKVFLSPEKTPLRKIREAILSVKLEKRFTKEEIFSFYLNQIPYGSNAYGVEAAAQTFFGKSASGLTLAESATLAALPKAPSFYSPYGPNKDALLARKDGVLEKMAAIGFVTPEALKNAKEEPLVFAQQRESIKAPHFVMFVKNYLEEKYGVDAVENSGLKVYTTLDYNLQKAAEETITKIGAENEKKYKAKNAALVSIDPKTGQLLAMVGSRDYFNTAHDGNFNVVTSKNRQPGSSFKPFAYSVFFEKGYPPETALFDAKTEFSTNPDEPYSPGNYDEKFRGPVAAQSALAQSLNVPSVKVLYLAGIDDTVRLAHDMGITTLQDRSALGLSLVLGGGEVSPYDMAHAYGVFANDGMRNDKAFILSVQDQRGTLLEKWEPKQKQALSPNTARTISGILSSNELRAPVFGEKSFLFFDGYQVAAKTGTTQKYRDAWVVGYTPSLATAVWVGNNDATPMEKGGAGIAAAGPIFHSFMQQFLTARMPESFARPDPIVSSEPVLDGKYITEKMARIDKDSGKLATDRTPPQKIIQKPMQEIHSVLYYLQKNKPFQDPQLPGWESAIEQWLRENPSFNIPQQEAIVGYDDIHTQENTPLIQILSPQDNAMVSGASLIRVDVRARFAIKEVGFYLDEALLSSRAQYPYEYLLNMDGLSPGTHTLSVAAHDQYDNTGTAQISFTR